MSRVDIALKRCLLTLYRVVISKPGQEGWFGTRIEIREPQRMACHRKTTRPILFFHISWYLSAPAAREALQPSHRGDGRFSQQRVYRTWVLTAAYIRAWLAHRVEHCAFNAGVTGSNPVPNSRGNSPPKTLKRSPCNAEGRPAPDGHVSGMIGRGRRPLLSSSSSGRRPTPASHDTFRRNALQRVDSVAAGWGNGMMRVRSSIR